MCEGHIALLSIFARLCVAICRCQGSRHIPRGLVDAARDLSHWRVGAAQRFRGARFAIRILRPIEKIALGGGVTGRM